MSCDIVPTRLKNGKRHDSQREQGQQVDGAPRPPHADRMDEERATRDQNHEKRPCPADRPVRERSFGGQKLQGPQTDRHECEGGVEPNDRGGVEQRGERHTPTLGVSTLSC